MSLKYRDLLPDSISENKARVVAIAGVSLCAISAIGFLFSHITKTRLDNLFNYNADVFHRNLECWRGGSYSFCNQSDPNNYMKEGQKAEQIMNELGPRIQLARRTRDLFLYSSVPSMAIVAVGIVYGRRNGLTSLSQLFIGDINNSDVPINTAEGSSLIAGTNIHDNHISTAVGSTSSQVDAIMSSSRKDSEKLLEILSMIRKEISSSVDISADCKSIALDQVDNLRKISKDIDNPGNSSLKTTAMLALRGFQSGLPQAAKTVTSLETLLNSASSLLGLVV